MMETEMLDRYTVDILGFYKPQANNEALTQIWTHRATIEWTFLWCSMVDGLQEARCVKGMVFWIIKAVSYGYGIVSL